jgi:hypothetical protein
MLRMDYIINDLHKADMIAVNCDTDVILLWDA